MPLALLHALIYHRVVSNSSQEGVMYRRLPKGYEGTQPTSRSINELLTPLLQRMQIAYKDNPQEVMAAWPEIIGSKFAPMTQVVGFSRGVLKIIVKNSTLYSLLVQHERPRLVRALRARFAHVEIRDIVFRIG